VPEAWAMNLALLGSTRYTQVYWRCRILLRASFIKYKLNQTEVPGCRYQGPQDMYSDVSYCCRHVPGDCANEYACTSLFSWLNDKTCTKKDAGSIPLLLGKNYWILHHQVNPICPITAQFGLDTSTLTLWRSKAVPTPVEGLSFHVFLHTINHHQTQTRGVELPWHSQDFTHPENTPNFHQSIEGFSKLPLHWGLI